MQSPSFADMVHTVAERRLVPALTRDDSKRYIEAGERVAEAALVEPLARAFARYEVDPPATGRGLGRYSPVSLIPPVGSVLRTHAALRDREPMIVTAVLRTLAVGYAMWASVAPSQEAEGLDPAVVEDRDPTDIWAFWVTNSHSGLVGNLVAPDFSNFLIAMSEDEFLSALADADAKPRLRKRTRLSLLGRTYGEAGVLLRYAQSGLLSDERLLTDLRAQMTMNWPLDRR